MIDTNESAPQTVQPSSQPEAVQTSPTAKTQKGPNKYFLVGSFLILVSILATTAFLSKKTNNKNTASPGGVAANQININTFIPGKQFKNNCFSGEKGVFNANGSVDVTWGRDYVPNDTRPNFGTGNWEIQSNKLVISDTSISDGEYDLVFSQDVAGNQIAKTFTGKSCGLTIQANSEVTQTKPTIMYYMAPAAYESISFESFSTYPVHIKNDKEYFPLDGQGIVISQLDINNFDYSESGPGFTKEKIQSYYNELQQGKVSGKSPFSLWSLDATDQVKKTKTGKFFWVSTTFAAYDVCDFKFHTAIDIPVNNKFIHILILGDKTKIRNSLTNSELLTLWTGCTEKSFVDKGQQKFYDLLTRGEGTPEAKEWYNAANEVIDSLNF